MTMKSVGHRYNREMIRSLIHIFLLVSLITTTAAALAARPAPDEPWISHYSGGISMETEMAYLDDFAIQIMNDPDLMGYILVYSGENSCRYEAQTRALRMKEYLVERRGVPWNRVMWKDAGRFRGQGLEIFHLGVPRAKLPTFGFPYEAPAQGQVIRACTTSKRTRGSSRH
jgi:hypothetical protein